MALQAERDVAGSEQASQELAECVKQARQLGDRERELRREAGKTFAELAVKWNALADLLSERSALTAQVAREQLIERLGIFDREARQRWDEATVFVVEPVPTTLAAFLDELLQATTGRRPDEDEDGLAELNRHRAVLGLVPEQRYVSPSARELAAIYPDLRQEVRTAEVSGVAIRRRESVEAPWPDEAA